MIILATHFLFRRWLVLIFAMGQVIYESDGNKY